MAWHDPQSALVLNRCEMYILLDETRAPRSQEVVRRFCPDCAAAHKFSLPFLGYHSCDLDPDLRPEIAIGPLAAQAA
jgi:hypothetical protein